MIRMYDTATMNQWNRGELRVRLDLPGRRLPMGYCDGTDEDEAELRAMAEDEGVEHLRIDKKLLKTGREIWTLGDPPETAPGEAGEDEGGEVD